MGVPDGEHDGRGRAAARNTQCGVIVDMQMGPRRNPSSAWPHPQHPRIVREVEAAARPFERRGQHLHGETGNHRRPPRGRRLVSAICRDGDIPRAEARLESDTQRKGKGGVPLGCRGFCAQVVGDWKMMKDVFRYPQHNERAGICFLCNATPTTMRQTGFDAPWRAGRMDHWAVLARIAENGLPISPLFQAPGVRVDVCKVDWLHVVDLGVGPDWIRPSFV